MKPRQQNFLNFFRHKTTPIQLKQPQSNSFLSIGKLKFSPKENKVQLLHSTHCDSDEIMFESVKPGPGAVA